MDNFDMEGEVTETPMSRTHQYRKVMKPMLERKRRARINKCLDELKDLMVFALQTEGESITKLEKADVLELTVRHLRKLRRQEMLTLSPQGEQERQESYRAGYTACAAEISQFLPRVAPSVDLTTRTRLLSHLAHKLALPQVRGPPAPPVPQYQLKPSPLPQEADLGYNSGRDSTPSPSPPSTSSSQETVWRPF